MIDPKVKAAGGTAVIVVLLMNALRSSGVPITPEWSELVVAAVPLIAAYLKRNAASPPKE